jgi:Lon protease-like protein
LKAFAWKPVFDFLFLNFDFEDMINFIPIFPLDIIVYPGEMLNLHIFEPRYKQLINECLKEHKPFGLPSVKDKQVQEYGTLMEITELVKEYDNGEMDVKTRGINIFRVLEVVKDVPDKLYGGAIVNYPQNFMSPGDSELSRNIIKEVKRLYTLMDVEEKFKFPDGKKMMLSYEIGHYVGLSKQQEYELLCIFTEIQRLEYIRRHLNDITAVVQELERMKARVQMNGHFRDLSIGDLDI